MEICCIPRKLYGNFLYFLTWGYNTVLDQSNCGALLWGLTAPTKPHFSARGLCRAMKSLRCTGAQCHFAILILLAAWIPCLDSFTLNVNPITVRSWGAGHAGTIAAQIFGRQNYPNLERLTPIFVRGNRRRIIVRTNLSADDRKVLWEEIARLELELQEAIREEEYSVAARLRDQIKESKQKDPYCKAEEVGFPDRRRRIFFPQNW